MGVEWESGMMMEEKTVGSPEHIEVSLATYWKQESEESCLYIIGSNYTRSNKVVMPET